MANKDLEIGDRVMLSPNHDYRITKTTPAEYNPVGIKGTVVPYTWGLQEGHWVQVDWDNGLTNHYPITDDYLLNIKNLGNKMTNHTPEPWSIDKYGCVTAPSVTASHRSIEVGGFSLSGSQLAELNSRRIVACINACAGVSNDALDGGWEAAGISAYAQRLESDLAAVTAQRDELLAAMKIVTTGTVGDILDRLHEFQALVVKCEAKP